MATRAIPCYSVVDKAALTALRATLRSAVGARPARVQVLSRTFCDTPDRRLYHAGRVLETIERAGERRLVLRALNDAEVLATEAIAAPVRYAEDLPEGTLRDLVAALAGPRVLLPLARVRSRVTPIAVLDKQGRVGFTIELDEARLRNGKGRTDQPLGCRVRLGEGHGKLRKRIRTLIEDHAGIEGPSRDLFDAALGSGAIPAPVDLSRPKVTLDPAALAGAAVAQVLGAYFHTVDANEDGVIADLDSEFLHDYRVALRSSRSILSRMREVFPEREHEKARADLAWLSKLTGPKRDLDVFLGDVDRHATRLPVLWRPYLDLLRTYLREQREIEHRRLVEALRSERYRAFKRDHPAWLERATRRRIQSGPGAERAVVLASQAIWRAYHALLSEGYAVMEDTPIAALHELRKIGKKLRYLVEAFQSLYPPDALRQIVSKLKHLQNCLGAIVDRDVERRLLQRFGDALSAPDPPASEETLMAMKMLEAVLYEEQEAHRSGFEAAFSRFARPRNQRLFRALFAPADRALSRPERPNQ